MSLTRIEKYSERGYILKNPPGRLLIVTYWTALGVWLAPGGRPAHLVATRWEASFAEEDRLCKIYASHHETHPASS